MRDHHSVVTLHLSFLSSTRGIEGFLGFDLGYFDLFLAVGDAGDVLFVYGFVVQLLLGSVFEFAELQTLVHCGSLCVQLLFFHVVLALGVAGLLLSGWVGEHVDPHCVRLDYASLGVCFFGGSASVLEVALGVVEGLLFFYLEFLFFLGDPVVEFVLLFF